jgi:hypothetical protein
MVVFVRRRRLMLMYARVPLVMLGHLAKQVYLRTRSCLNLFSRMLELAITYFFVGSIFL